MTALIDLTGASGARYRFTQVDENRFLPPAGANYVIAHIKSGKLRAIAVTGTKRARAFPDVAPVAEQGYPSYKVTAWFGVAAPARTAPEIVARLHREISAVLAVPETQERLTGLGLDLVSASPEQSAAFIKSEIELWGKLVRQSGAKLE